MGNAEPVPPGFDEAVEEYYKAKEPYNKLFEEAMAHRTSEVDDDDNAKEEKRPPKWQYTLPFPKFEKKPTDSNTTADAENSYPSRNTTAKELGLDKLQNGASTGKKPELILPRR